MLELMVHRLPQLVGSPLSINALREELQVSHATVSQWIEILENLYFLYRVYPFGSPKIKAVKKESKHYHFDWSMIPKEGPRFENLVACHLLKWCHYLEDTEGLEMEIRYFRDVEHAIFMHAISQAKALQLVLHPEIDRTDSDGIRMCNARYFLPELV